MKKGYLYLGFSNFLLTIVLLRMLKANDWSITTKVIFLLIFIDVVLIYFLFYLKR